MKQVGVANDSIFCDTALGTPRKFDGVGGCFNFVIQLLKQSCQF